MDKPKFVYVTFIATTPEKLWKALTDGEFTRRYWAGIRWKSDWKVGSKVECRFPDGRLGNSGVVLEFDPPRRLSYTWHVEFHAAMSKEPASRVTYELQPDGEVVKLTLIHDQFEPGSVVYDGIREGWPGVLASLKSFLETGSGLANMSEERLAAKLASMQ